MSIPKINVDTDLSSSLKGPKYTDYLKKFFLKLQRSKKVFLVFVMLFSFFITFTLVNFVFAVDLTLKTRNLIESGNRFQSAFESRDMGGVEVALDDLRLNHRQLSGSYSRFVWVKYVPILRSYWFDGVHIVNATGQLLDSLDVAVSRLKPYADLLGFETGNSNSTISDRLEFIVATIDLLQPHLKEISLGALQARQELSYIDLDRYPEYIFGKPVRAKLAFAIDLVNQTSRFIVDGEPLLSQTSYLLGIDKPRRFLIIFQNDKELRPTGGFMTAYSIMEVNKGKINQVVSDDIYSLDANYKPSIPAPQAIINYIKGPYTTNQNYYLRDMNFSPDFAESMKLFSREAETVGIEDIDGIIAVDTQVVEKMLDVLGEIGVPGFGNFSSRIVAECNCPQVIYELESYADVEGPVVFDPVTGDVVYQPPNADDRKGVIGPLMNSIIANSLGQPLEKLPGLIDAVYTSLTEKHILFYLFDRKAQQAMESFGSAGRIEDFDGDYLHINNANLGGRKSNLYVTWEVVQDVSIKDDGSIEKTVEITYRNPQRHDGWLNSVLPNWLRVYVPEGSEIISIDGLENVQDPYTELGKTVFAGYFELRPLGIAKIRLRYKLPFKAEETYNLFIQKQPGVSSVVHRIKIDDYEEEFEIRTDRSISVDLK